MVAFTLLEMTHVDCTFFSGVVVFVIDVYTKFIIVLTLFLLSCDKPSY